MFSYSVYRAIRLSLLNLPVIRHLRGGTVPSIVQPQSVSPVREVPTHIKKPPYITTGIYESGLTEPEIKTSEQIQGLREACKVARRVLDRAGDSLRVGITTEELDVLVHEECIKNNSYPSPLLYKGFPKSVCTSVNNVACHGIPDSRPLEDGDIINIDITVYYNGYHGDVSETFLIGHVDFEGQALVRVARECRDVGVSVCRPGTRFWEIGIAIEEYAESQGFNVIPNFTGHGIGEYFHGPPHVYHVGCIDEELEQIMQPGMTFTIEPILSEGWEDVRILDDGWTAVSLDDSRSAQFEHTVLITDTGVDILTAKQL